MKSVKRREFLKAAGSLTIGFSIAGAACVRGAEPVLQPLPDEDQINAWLRITGSGKVQVITGKMELGQGLSTAIRQVAAEELSLPVEQTEIQLAETGVTPDEGYTAGSRSMESSAMNVRRASACAREKLVSLAAEKWGVPATEVRMENGKLVHDNKEQTLADLLAGRQLTDTILEPGEIYAKTRRKTVGHPVPREDIARMVRGKMTYVQDLRFDGMVHARIIRPPSYTARLEHIDISGWQDDPSVTIIRDGSFVGVIAGDEWEAIRVSRQLKDKITWKEGDPLPRGSLKDQLTALPADSRVDERTGDPDGMIGDNTHEATYFKPYIMHAANGPSCAVALYDNNQLSVWTHSQGVYPLRSSLAAMLNIPAGQISVKGVPGSGCYGHNGADDVAAEAALLAMNYPGRHVRLQWMREEEHGWEPYGTAMLMKLKAGIDGEGRIMGWTYDLWSDGHSTRPGGNAGSLLPARFLEKPHPAPSGGFRGGATRNARPYYVLENMQLSSHIVSGPLRFSALRGLGAYANIFAIESFMDELAEKAGKDPVDFRVMHLEDPRANYCLEGLREMISGVRTGENEGLGIAFSRYKNSATYCAVAALVDATDPNRPEVRQMWAFADAGEVINPDGLKNQLEGGMIQSASWALYEEVDFDSQHVTSQDWNTYPILRFQEAPTVEVRLIDRPDEPPLGAGEASQGPATAAIVNALYRATGSRYRELPVIRHK